MQYKGFIGRTLKPRSIHLQFITKIVTINSVTPTFASLATVLDTIPLQFIHLLRLQSST